MRYEDVLAQSNCPDEDEMLSDLERYRLASLDDVVLHAISNIASLLACVFNRARLTNEITLIRWHIIATSSF